MRHRFLGSRLRSRIVPTNQPERNIFELKPVAHRRGEGVMGVLPTPELAVKDVISLYCIPISLILCVKTLEFNSLKIS